MPAPLLEFSNLTVYRDLTRVLDRFSLTIPAGQNIAILGPNGSGKSTLIKLVTRELYPVVAPGAVLRVLGRDRWVLSELREHLGIVTNDLMATFCCMPRLSSSSGSVNFSPSMPKASRISSARRSAPALSIP